MNTQTPPCSAIDPAAWQVAVTEVNAWRGQAIQHFAVAEAAVSETLVSMAAALPPMGSVRLRRLVGQRFEDLRLAVDADGPYASEGVKAVAALAAFDRHTDLRACLCHGVAKVALDRHGQWVAILKVIALGGRAKQRTSMTFEKREGEALLADLKRDSHKLASALQSLRARISSGHSAPT